MDAPENPSIAQASIHWRRRWWYAVWVALLLGALGFWGLWETPVASGTGHVAFSVRVMGLPPGSRVGVWTGRARDWSPGTASFEGPWPVQDPSRPLPIPPVQIRAGLRRWHKGYIPRLTTDLIVFRIDPPQGPSKYLAYDLGRDLQGGLAGPHHRLSISAPVRWPALSGDASRPSPLLP